MPDLKVLNIINNRPQPRGDMDISLDGNGQFLDGPVFVSGSDRVVQDTVRGLLTRLGSNYLAPNFGTIIKTLLHARNVGDISGQLTSEVQFVLAYLAQFNSTESLSEQLAELVNLQAKQATDTIELNLTVKTGTGTSASVTVA